jgi:hypothetical protein
VGEVALLQSERLADSEPGPPEQDDQRAQPLTLRATSDDAHDRDDLLDRWRVCWVALALGARGGRLR